jgi:hypothetical protein
MRRLRQRDAIRVLPPIFAIAPMPIPFCEP